MAQINVESTKSLGKTFGVFFAVLGAIIIPISIYITRSLIAKVKFLASPFWFHPVLISLIVSIVFCIVVAIIYTLGWRFHWFKSGYTNPLRLLFAIIFATLIAYFGPLVSTPHQEYFERHKSEFDQQVELIKQGTELITLAILM